MYLTVICEPFTTTIARYAIAVAVLVVVIREPFTTARDVQISVRMVLMIVICKLFTTIEQDADLVMFGVNDSNP